MDKKHAFKVTCSFNLITLTSIYGFGESWNYQFNQFSAKTYLPFYRILRINGEIALQIQKSLKNFNYIGKNLEIAFYNCYVQY